MDKDSAIANENTPTEIPVGILCVECGYDLRYLKSTRCPECGCDIDEYRSTVPAVPWEHRKECGWVRAYCETIWSFTWFKNRFKREVYRPVTIRDAQIFRVITWLLVMLLTVGVLLALQMMFNKKGGDLDVVPSMVIGIGVIVPFVSGIILTGVPSYFFHPKYASVELQNRAIALSYYASASLLPLVILLWAVVGVLYLLGISIFEMEIAGGIAFLCCGLFPAFSVINYWIELIILAKRVFANSSRWIGVTLLLPIAWLVVSIFSFGIPVLLYYYVPFAVKYW